MQFLIRPMTTSEKILFDALRSAIGKPNPFDAFVEACCYAHDRPAHTLADLNVRKNTKLKGDVFEAFCKLYLLKIKGFEKVWLLKEIPEDVRLALGLEKRDVGIDIVGFKDEEYYAVQCKFKRPRARALVPGTFIRTNVVTWKELSTFYGLCARTGIGGLPIGNPPRFARKDSFHEPPRFARKDSFHEPPRFARKDSFHEPPRFARKDSFHEPPRFARWAKRKGFIVMTNAQNVSRKGKKNEQDWSICLKTFQALNAADFNLLLSDDSPKGNVPEKKNVEVDLDLDEVRRKRLIFFGA